MLLTKIWTAILALLATLFLAGMFLLSHGSAGGFSDADRAAIRATTEAGIAALTAEIHASPVSRASALLQTPELKAALGPQKVEDGDKAEEQLPLQQTFVATANAALLDEYPQMSVGLLDADGKVIVSTGVNDTLVGSVGELPNYKDTAAEQDAQFSAAFDNYLYVVRLFRADDKGRRLVALQPLNIGAGSFLRTVLGTDNPAGLVRGGKLLQEGKIGTQTVETELTTMAKSHASETPQKGASSVARVGEGKNARIGSIGRVPGPAGRGENGVYLVVLSNNTAAAGQHDLASALKASMDNGGMEHLNLTALIGLLLVSVTLALYLPNLEGTGPIRRLTQEFRAMLQGTQQQLFYDTYTGPIGELAQAAVAYHETLRASLQSAEMELDGEGGGTRSHRRVGTRSNRRLRTGAQRSVRKAEPQQPQRQSDPDDMPTQAHQAVGRGPGFFTMPATKPLRSRETVIGNLMTVDNDTSTPEATNKGDAEREAYYQNVYEEFIKFKVENNEAIDNFTYEKFATKLRANTATLMKRQDVKDVQFSVYLKDGKVALKARVVRG